MTSVIPLTTQPPGVDAFGDRVGGNTNLMGRSHTATPLRHLANRLWIRRFLVRPQEGQLQAPPSLASDGGVCSFRSGVGRFLVRCGSLVPCRRTVCSACATRKRYLTAPSILSVVSDRWTRSLCCRSSPQTSPSPFNSRSLQTRPTGNWRGRWASHMARRTTLGGACRPRRSFVRARGR
jgi:hypothetical protein